MAKKELKYWGVKDMTKYLAKEINEFIGYKIKGVPFKEKKGNKEQPIGALTDAPQNKVLGRIRLQGNPAKVAGKLPDGWTYDPKTNRFKNGNLADPTYIEIEPLKKDKPLYEIQDMSDVMYLIRMHDPDLKVRALDSDTFAVDLGGKNLDEVDWKKIGGSNLEYNKETGTINATTAEGKKLSFYVMSENHKTSEENKEKVSKETYTGDQNGVISSGFSEGNGKSVEDTASKLLGVLAGMNIGAMMVNANMSSLSTAEAIHLWETCNIIPNPNSDGDLMVQDRYTGVVKTDPKIVAQMSILYSMVNLMGRSSGTENNPLIDIVTRGEIDRNAFDKMYTGFQNNPQLLNEAVENMQNSMSNPTSSNGANSNAGETAVVTEAIQEEAVKTAENDAPAMNNGGTSPSEPANLKKTYSELVELSIGYTCEVIDGDVVIRDNSGSALSKENDANYHWVLLKKALDERFGDPTSASNALNNILSQANWIDQIKQIVYDYSMQLINVNEKEDENEMTMKPPIGNGGGSN